MDNFIPGGKKSRMKVSKFQKFHKKVFYKTKFIYLDIWLTFLFLTVLLPYIYRDDRVKDEEFNKHQIRKHAMHNFNESLEKEYINSLKNAKSQLRNNQNNNDLSSNSPYIEWEYFVGYWPTSPAIGRDNTIYTGSEEGIYAFNPDGTLKWENKSVTIYRPVSIGPDETVYFMNGYSSITAYCPNGKFKWGFYPSARITRSLVIDSDGNIYFGCEDGYFYAVYPFGDLKWKYNTGSSGISNAAIGADGTIYFHSKSGHVFALNQEGNLQWRVFTGDNGIGNTIIDSNGTIYFSGYDLNAFSPGGNLKWSRDYYFSGGIIIGIDGTLYGANGDLYALNSRNGSLEWKYNLKGYGFSPAIISDRTIYHATHMEGLHALNINGSLKWKISLPLACSPNIGLDGTIYIGSKQYFHAISNSSLDLAITNWSKWKHDRRNTGSVQPDISFFPPLNFCAEKKEERSLFLKDYVIYLSWELNPLSEQETKTYRIYQINGQFRTLLVELYSDTFEYYHFGIEKDEVYYYGIVPVDSQGKEGSFSYTKVY